jgi:hypothetical protein
MRQRLLEILLIALGIAILAQGALIANRLANQTDNPAVLWSSSAPSGEYELGFRADGVVVWRKR